MPARSETAEVFRPRGPATVLVLLVAAVLVLGTGLALALGGGQDNGPAPGEGGDPDRAPTPPGATPLPTDQNTGVPPGWRPRRTLQGTVTVSTPGAVVEDLRIVRGNLVVTAPDVTVRRVEVLGGVIDNFTGSTCATGLTISRTTLRRAPGQVTAGDTPAVGIGGYTADRVLVTGLPEGFRVGGAQACGPVRILDSLARVAAPDECGDWHGDALQGYDGAALTVRNTVLELVERDDCHGTAAFFYPSGQGNATVDIDGLVVSGGGFPFRLGTPGSVRGLHVVAGSWIFGPLDVACSALTAWETDVVEHDGGRPRPVRPLRCDTEGGG